MRKRCSLFFARAAEDRRLRFLMLGNDLARTAHDETNVDYVRSFGLLATVGPEQGIVGHAFYAPYGDGRAEVAFAIAREYHGADCRYVSRGRRGSARAGR
jgi:hypothetical protein